MLPFILLLGAITTTLVFYLALIHGSRELMHYDISNYYDMMDKNKLIHKAVKYIDINYGGKLELTLEDLFIAIYNIIEIEMLDEGYNYSFEDVKLVMNKILEKPENKFIFDSINKRYTNYDCENIDEEIDGSDEYETVDILEAIDSANK